MQPSRTCRDRRTVPCSVGSLHAQGCYQHCLLATHGCILFCCVPACWRQYLHRLYLVSCQNLLWSTSTLHPHLMLRCITCRREFIDVNVSQQRMRKTFVHAKVGRGWRKRPGKEAGRRRRGHSTTVVSLAGAMDVDGKGCQVH